MPIVYVQCKCKIQILSNTKGLIRSFNSNINVCELALGRACMCHRWLRLVTALCDTETKKATLYRNTGFGFGTNGVFVHEFVGFLVIALHCVLEFCLWRENKCTILFRTHQLSCILWMLSVFVWVWVFMCCAGFGVTGNVWSLFQRKGTSSEQKMWEKKAVVMSEIWQAVGICCSWWQY
jgi:hypothetical protein